MLINQLKQPCREALAVRRLRKSARAALRRSLLEAEVLAAPLGYYRCGFRFCKHR